VDLRPPRDVALPPLSAGAALPLTGRYAALAGQSANGLRAWAATCGARLTIEDCGDDPVEVARLTVALADRVDVLFGPYGSGPTRAAAQAIVDREIVLWNHGGAAVEVHGARVVDVLAPADRYWAGLGALLVADGVDIAGVAILHSDGGFGRAVASGAVSSIRRAGATPLILAPFDQTSAAAAASRAQSAGATAIIGCGRFDDDVALGTALCDATCAVALVACGVAAAADHFGDHVLGWLGPCQWLAGADTPAELGSNADYLAAQAYACGLIAQQTIAIAGGPEARHVWDAVRGLRTSTFFGDFAVDRQGRQIGHVPLIVRWVNGAGGPMRQVAWPS
jgi:branched-chain amino acid transport system substrate-binding protein